jgi:hypothetical protein
VRAKVREEERGQFFKYMNNQEYQIYTRTHVEDKRRWDNVVTEFKLRSDTIRTKMKELAPDMNEMVVI